MEDSYAQHLENQRHADEKFNHDCHEGDKAAHKAMEVRNMKDKWTEHDASLLAKFIVEAPQVFKVQISITTNQSRKQVLIYNKDESLLWTGNASRIILKKMKGAKKKYFWGEYNMKTKQIKISVEADKKYWF